MVEEILRIFQSLATFSEPRSVGEGLAFSLSPSRTKDGGCQGAAWLLKGWALMDTLSSSAAKHLSTWFCHQVYLLWVRLVLQPSKCAEGLLGLYRGGKMCPF